MGCIRAGLGAVLAILAMVTANTTHATNAAADTVLIQVDPDGGFRVWHNRGETALTESELQELGASAAPQGGRTVATAAGPARAYETDSSIRIEVPEAQRDRTLLVSRDPCGWASVWHSAGSVVLTDAQLTELVVSALPSGGKNMAVGNRVAKAYTVKLGVVAVIWQPRVRRP